MHHGIIKIENNEQGTLSHLITCSSHWYNQPCLCVPRMATKGLPGDEGELMEKGSCPAEAVLVSRVSRSAVCGAEAV